MKRFLVRRALLAVVTVLVASVFVFLVVHLIPGDPIGVRLATYPNPEVRVALERHYGLDRPLQGQYVTWLGGVLRGRLGHSFFTGEPTTTLISQRYPRTLALMAGGLAFAVVFAIPASLLSASRARGPRDGAVTTTALAMQSLPEFWLGTMLVLVFGVQLGLLPTAGYVALTEDAFEFLRHSILPMVTIGMLLAGILTRTLRASVRNEMRSDYVAAAATQGIPVRRLLLVHVLRNAVVPALTLLGLNIGYLVAGAVVTEKVFSYPGMGLLLVDALSGRDYPVVQGAILVFGATFVALNVAVDALAIWLDPKQRQGMVASRPVVVGPGAAP